MFYAELRSDRLTVLWFFSNSKKLVYKHVLVSHHITSANYSTTCCSKSTNIRLKSIDICTNSTLFIGEPNGLLHVLRFNVHSFGN